MSEYRLWACALILAILTPYPPLWLCDGLSWISTTLKAGMKPADPSANTVFS